MNILDKMDLLAKLRTYKEESQKDEMLMEERATLDLSFQNVALHLQKNISKWIEDRGEI